MLNYTRLASWLVAFLWFSSAGASAASLTGTILPNTIEYRYVSVEEALDENYNCIIDDQEYRKAVSFWVQGTLVPIPGTSGVQIMDRDILVIVQLWVTSRRIPDCTQGSQPRPPTSSAPRIVGFEGDRIFEVGDQFTWYIDYQDPDADIVKLLLQKYRNGQWINMGSGDPGSYGKTSGRIRINFHCETPEQTTIAIQLEDAAGNQSEPYNVDLECRGSEGTPPPPPVEFGAPVVTATIVQRGTDYCEFDYCVFFRWNNPSGYVPEYVLTDSIQTLQYSLPAGVGGLGWPVGQYDPVCFQVRLLTPQGPTPWSERVCASLRGGIYFASEQLRLNLSSLQTTLQIFDLQGRLVFEDAIVSSRKLGWNMLDFTGAPVANGVYLQVITSRDDWGKVRKEIKKIAVLR